MREPLLWDVEWSSDFEITATTSYDCNWWDWHVYLNDKLIGEGRFCQTDDEARRQCEELVLSLFGKWSRKFHPNQPDDGNSKYLKDGDGNLHMEDPT